MKVWVVVDMVSGDESNPSIAIYGTKEMAQAAFDRLQQDSGWDVDGEIPDPDFILIGPEEYEVAVQFGGGQPFTADADGTIYVEPQTIAEMRDLVIDGLKYRAMGNAVEAARQEGIEEGRRTMRAEAAEVAMNGWHFADGSEDDDDREEVLHEPEDIAAAIRALPIVPKVTNNV